MKLKSNFLLLCFIGALNIAPLAQASTIGSLFLFTLNQDGCSGGCGTSPFADVTLTQLSATSVDVHEVLLNGDEYVDTGAGASLEFNIAGNPMVNISNLTTGFFNNGPASASTFGSFGYSVDCAKSNSNPNGCKSGASGPLPGPLDFHVSVASGTLDITDFGANSNGDIFASDIIGNNGNTGNVASISAVSSIESVPEPSSVIMLFSGLASLLILRKRRSV